MSNADPSYPENSPSKGHSTRDLGFQLRILQLNMKGISMGKSSYLERLLQEREIDVVMLQETHVPDEQQISYIHIAEPPLVVS